MNEKALVKFYHHFSISNPDACFKNFPWICTAHAIPHLTFSYPRRKTRKSETAWRPGTQPLVCASEVAGGQQVSHWPFTCCSGPRVWLAALGMLTLFLWMYLRNTSAFRRARVQAWGRQRCEAPTRKFWSSRCMGSKTSRSGFWSSGWAEPWRPLWFIDTQC